MFCLFMLTWVYYFIFVVVVVVSNFFCWLIFFFSSRRRHTRLRISDWSSDVCSSDLVDRDRRDAAEAQRQERLAAERTREQAQERQQAQDREKVAEKFRTIAGKREAGTHGYGDHNSDWKATPEALRKAV